MEFMGMCRAMDPAQAQTMRAQLDDEWQLQEDKDQHLRLSREYRTRNFVSALELCNRIGDIAEQVRQMGMGGAAGNAWLA